ncbi:Uu.00g065170.m01.CDS01 [Anthostomella pinea]|uniref:Uu.00g065170.m01.CDS01 n=1 Tax=Anthostomella pinea TaxID=933095 RepID=A0AAI8YKR5_9PEZI|nr:Uu.00g065170.m01.CDS01 [Anthostomella pinea]
MDESSCEAPERASTQHLSILWAGLNAHSQLQTDPTTDVRSFAHLSVATGQHDDLDILFAGWSSTVLRSREKVWSLGYQNLASTIEASPRSAFGDHDGLIGFLDDDGGLVLVVNAAQNPESSAMSLATKTTDSSPRLSHIALAVLEFENLVKFLAWYHDPSGEGNYPDKHHMLEGRPKQLLANTATFLLLMEDGEVYSWGDPRYHQSLGRATIEEDVSVPPADEPGLVDAIGGLKIAKIASGGCMSAALSEDSALYLWGASNAPGAEQRIKCLRETTSDDVALVELPGDDDSPLVVLDVALGGAHAAVAAEHSGRNLLYVVGDNKNGQPGRGSEEGFLENWMQVEGISGVHREVCGPRSTYAFIFKP